MKYLKDVVYVIFGLACMVGTFYLIYLPSSGLQMTPKEQSLSAALQFVITTLSSLIFSYFFAKSGVFEKNDPIAEASAEKIVNLSISIDRLKEFLLSSIDSVESKNDSAEVQLNGLKNRIESAAEMAVLLALSNQTFKTDWLGVVSSSMRDKIEQKYLATTEWINATDKRQKLEKKLEASGGNSALAAEIVAQLRTTDLKIESLADTIPSVTVPLKKSPATAVNNQTYSVQDEFKQAGQITVSVFRGVTLATGSGKLSPKMVASPHVEVKLESSPEEFDAGKFKIYPGTGTNYDFNVTIKSIVPGQLVPVGDYVFSFEATAVQPSALESA
ncbi:hypothetical protein RJC98_15395 [Pseudomonas allii]|uniref:Uncharacterized protein n=1 Tax=Pseudomonas allii TaxID=2740531 RepID=A0ACC6LE96_9PSED|nr:hypothetical protein [Pseudomonas allii]MDR9876575.1 hypothetical protein [Pseudomonas allii]